MRAPEGLWGTMDLWNRAAISLVALFLLLAAVVTLLVTLEAVDPDFLPGGSVEPSDAWFYDQLTGIAHFTGGDQAVTIAVTIMVAVFMLVLLFLEVPPVVFRRLPVLQVSHTAEGASTVEASSVRLLAERTGISNRNVNSIRCRLTVRRRPTGGGAASIVINCYPRVSLGSDLQEIRDDLQTRIKDVVQDLTGLTVLQVHVVRVRYDRGDDSRLIGA